MPSSPSRNAAEVTMVHDIEGGSVVLDKAQALGLMGYPDILGREITVSYATTVNRHADEWEGVATAVGPIGFILRTVHATTVLVRSDSISGTHTAYRFFPWTAVMIYWSEFKPDEEPTDAPR
jgi:hypothetical protein